MSIYKIATMKTVLKLNRLGERVMLPMTVLRRFDCVLAESKDQVLKTHAKLEAGGKLTNLDPTLNKIAKDSDGRELGFHNHSSLDFQKLKGDPDNIGRHLEDYINGFYQKSAPHILAYFDLVQNLTRLGFCQMKKGLA